MSPRPAPPPPRQPATCLSKGMFSIPQFVSSKLSAEWNHLPSENELSHRHSLPVFVLFGTFSESTHLH